MKTISVAVSESDYNVFRQAAESSDRSIAQLIREAMAYYRTECLQVRRPLKELPLFSGRYLIGTLPTREELYDEIHHWEARPI
jgi:hypothetical protein